MKNSDIHKGLVDKEIRDFLSMSLVRIYEDTQKIVRIDLDFDNTPYDMRIKTTKEEIRYLQEHLKVYEDTRAVLTLIFGKGWQEFDVSNDTVNNLSSGLFMSFIGTKKEYDNLIKKINKNEERKD
jgi:hypothetical protein